MLEKKEHGAYKDGKSHGEGSRVEMTCESPPELGTFDLSDLPTH